MTVRNDILIELSAPFHPSRVIWKPQAITKNKDKAMAVAYADLRAYQNRLDEVCGMDWAVSYTPWSDRIICHLTIGGVTRSSTGEPDSDSERSEISGTVSEAQAFKRACAMFGLGRYLYSLPSTWIEYDEQRRDFTEKGKARLNGLLAQHYQRYLDEHALKMENPVEKSDELEKARKAFHAEVSATFPKDDIEAARHWLIESYTTKQTDKVRSSTNDLTLGEINELAGNLKTYRKALRDRWTKESAQPVTA